MYDPKEEEFLNQVRRLKEIGFGRMIQIIAYEWSEKHPKRAVYELAPERTAIRLDEFFAAKASDPLAHQWKRFNKNNPPA